MLIIRFEWGLDSVVIFGLNHHRLDILLASNIKDLTYAWATTRALRSTESQTFVSLIYRMFLW